MPVFRSRTSAASWLLRSASCSFSVLLRRHRLFQARDLAHAVLGEPHAVLQQDYGDSERGGEPLHGRESLADRAP